MIFSKKFLSFVLNKDFSLHIKTEFLTSKIEPPLVEGRNVFSNKIQGEYYIDVYKMNTLYDGICYTIASNHYGTSESNFLITLTLNESISESKIPPFINGVISTRNERYGSVFGSWPGTSAFAFKLPLGHTSP
jgi:hypothetical protein